MIHNTTYPKRYKVDAPKQEDGVENYGNNDLWKDPFENLCNDIIHHIMSFLPTIKDIGRLSLLSRRWFHLWSIYPYLDFSGVIAPLYLRQFLNPQTRARLENYTECIIRSSLSHRPHLENDFSTASKIFTFKLKGCFSYHWFRQCIRYALMHSVEDLKLVVQSFKCYDLPRELFTCKAMQNLELKSDLVQCQNDFGRGSFLFPLCYMVAGLDADINPELQSHLRTLTLDHVAFPTDPLTPSVAMFSKEYFPYLTRLTLSRCEGVYFLEVNCPNLVYLEIKWMPIIKLVLKTPKLMTLRVESCFAENEGVASVDIWAPILEVFHWRGNGNPSWFYVQAPMHVIESEVSLQTLNVEESRVDSATNLLSLFCMARIFKISDGLLMGLAKLDTAGILAQKCTELVKVKLTTSMTKKQILGIWYILRMSPMLSVVDVHITGHPFTEDDNVIENWGRHSFDSINMSEGDFWEFQSKFQSPMLQQIEMVRIFIRKDVEDSDISFATYLLQQCRGLRSFLVYPCSSVSNQRKIKTIRRQILNSKKASRNVHIVVRIPVVIVAVR